MSPALFSFKIALAIQGLLWFHEFGDCYFYFCKKCRWNLDRNCIVFIDDFRWHGHFGVLLHEHGLFIFSFICVFNFF